MFHNRPGMMINPYLTISGISLVLTLFEDNQITIQVSALSDPLWLVDPPPTPPFFVPGSGKGEQSRAEQS